jgi:predicted lipoprotein with Yx(FWY)xxD motif
MTSRSRMSWIVVALAGLVTVSGCGSNKLTGGGDTPAPKVNVAQNSSDAPLDPQGPAGLGELAAVPGASAAAPAGSAGGDTPTPEPTVAKKQKWVKIFSGPSATDITPPKSITSGSKVVELNATPNDKIGTYVADGAGRTLYRFDDDTARPPKATCNGDCATAWPPLLIKSPGKIFPKGVNPQILGYVERADGTCQVTVNGWPVYYFVGDKKPGDINGQGLNGKWFAVTPAGAKTRALPGPLASAGK